MSGTFRSVVAAALIVGGAGAARAQPVAESGCPDARAAWLAQRFPEAERHARACLEIRPNDVRVWFELSRALAGQGRYEDALQWSRRALERYPDDMDWLAHHIRVTAWSGDLDGAWALVGRLTSAALGDPDTARMVADLALWRADHAEAARRYSRWLEQFGDDPDVYHNRSVAYLEVDQPERALADARRACGLAPVRCAYYDDVRKQLSPYDAEVELSFTDSNTSAGWGNLVLGAGKRFVSGVRAGARVELMDRFGANGTSAVVAEGWASVPLPRRFVVSAQAGFGALDAPLSWTAQVEGGRAFAFGLEVYLKLWHLQFVTGPVEVVSPAVLFTRPRYELRARYFASYKETTGLTHAVVLEGHYTGWKRYRVRATGAGGQGTDVDDPLGVGLVEDFWELGAGVTRELGWRHRLSVGYSWRQGSLTLGELQPVDRTFRRQRVMLLYQVRL